MEDNKLFEKYSTEFINTINTNSMDMTGFQKAIEERDKYRVCKNCISCFPDSGYYSCSLNDIFLFTEDKFSCVDFESK